MGWDFGSCRHANRFFLILASNVSPWRRGSLQLQCGVRTQRKTTHRIHLQSSQTCRWFPHRYRRVMNGHDVNLYNEYNNSGVVLGSAVILSGEYIWQQSLRLHLASTETQKARNKDAVQI